jgi:carbonic anhydrase
LTVPANEALQRLRDGNARFVSGISSIETVANPQRRGELVDGQSPFAVVIGCSDSRVPVEMVFDQGLGDLFVIRVAGNVVARSQIGSVEFAAEKFGTRLVVILGHTQCGAVAATLDQLQHAKTGGSENLRFIVDQVRSSVEGLLDPALGHDAEALVRVATRTNVRIAANTLRQDSAVLKRLIEEEGLVVVGAEYALETGVIDFFDGLPETT